MDKNDFVKEYRAIVDRALSLVKKAVNEGFLSLEEMIDEEKFIQRDIQIFTELTTCDTVEK
jgi:flagellar motor component MotA